MNIELNQLQEEVRKWVFAGGPGDFSEYDVYTRFGLLDGDEKAAAISVLERLVKEKELERVGRRRGWYRLCDRSLDIINWRNASTQEFALKMPFKLHEQVRIFPKSIIVISGEKNSSKTAVCLDITKRNMNLGMPILYFSSEMLGPEFKVRLQAVEDISPDIWDFVPVHRVSNFQDVIEPDAINIIDFLEVYDRFWEVGKTITAIWQRLRNGIAIICVQKDKSKEHGRGGSFLIEKPRLTINLSKNVIDNSVLHTLHVTNCKFPRSPYNPNAKCIDFIVRNGWDLVNKSSWYYYGNKPAKQEYNYQQNRQDIYG